MKRSVLCIAVCAFLAIVASASASVQFSQTELTGMSAVDFNGFTTLYPGLFASPDYGDGQPAMSGVAGATGDLNPFIPGGTAYVRYGLNAADLAAFNIAISSGTETLDMVGFNDNNQIWEIGIWYDAGGIVEDSATISAAGSSTFSLAMPAAVSAAGVFVRNVLSPTAGDNFHASFSPVPEPMTIAVWAGLFAIGAISIRRRQR